MAYRFNKHFSYFFESILLTFAFNFFSALLAIIGALLGFFLLKNMNLIYYVLPLVAGSLVYIATTDLIPELHKELKISKSIILTVSFLLGLAVLYLLRVLI